MKILVASSGSYDDAADRLESPLHDTHSVFSFPWPEEAEIHVLNVAEVMYPVMVGVGPDAVDTSDVQVRTADDAKATANRSAMRFRSLGFTAEGLGMTGEPQAAILEHAKEWGADLIVVGLHDCTRVERFLIGSIAESVVKHAPCSVLVLKHRAGV